MDVYDFLINPATDDIVILNGDISVGKSDQQHVEHIMRASVGHYRQWPLIGVDIKSYQNGPFSPVALKQNIQRNLVSDNYNVRQVVVSTSGEVSINAERIQ